MSTAPKTIEQIIDSAFSACRSDIIDRITVAGEFVPNPPVPPADLPKRSKANTHQYTPYGESIEALQKLVDVVDGRLANQRKLASLNGFTSDRETQELRTKEISNRGGKLAKSLAVAGLVRILPNTEEGAGTNWKEVVATPRGYAVAANPGLLSKEEWVEIQREYDRRKREAAVANNSAIRPKDRRYCEGPGAPEMKKVLDYLVETGPYLRQTSLAVELGVEEGCMTRILRYAEARGWVKRKHTRNGHEISVTPEYRSA